MRTSGFAQPGAAAGPAADPQAPYVRVAVVGLVRREDEREAATATGAGESGDTGLGAGPSGGSGPKGDRPGGGARGGDRAVAGRWLLMHRTRPFEAWDPPGGRMERGEDLVEAVKREVAEETGLQIEVAGPCYAFLTVYEGERLLAVSMACRPLGDADRLTLEPGGAREWFWASAEEWEQLAALGRSSWASQDVRRATRMATVLWQTEGM